MSQHLMTRQSFYELVWSKPMTHLAKDFGMSDVAIRKHCVKHDIPTPSVGYWTKLAHGKHTRKPPLPVAKSSAEAPVLLSVRAGIGKSEESIRAAGMIEERRGQLELMLKVPDVVPEALHPIVGSIRAAMRRVKSDAAGYLHLDESNLPEILIGRNSIDRMMRILHSVLMVADSEGYEFVRGEHTCFLSVNDERFLLRIYEVREKRSHEPTKKELKEQARRDGWRVKYPSAYSDRTYYREWDYCPSGRLTFELRDASNLGWRRDTIGKRWRDRKSLSLEKQLPEIFTWLAPATIEVRDRRLG